MQHAGRGGDHLCQADGAWAEDLNVKQSAEDNRCPFAVPGLGYPCT